MISSVKRIFYSIFQRIRRIIELNKYNDFTIAEFFRAQGAQIGKDNRIEVRSLGAEPYLISIGNHCTIAPGVSFMTHDGGVWIFTDEFPSLQKIGKIEILDNCFIGLGAILMGNIKIGPNAIVGAGAIVTKDVPANTIVGGNPAKVISSIDKYKEKVIRNWKKQKPPGYFNGLEDGVRYDPAYIQKIKFRDLHILRNHLKKIFWKS